MQFPVQAKLLVTPAGAQGKAAGEITQVATSPTGQHVAAGHADGTIRIWNIDTGDCEVRQIWHASNRSITSYVETITARHVVCMLQRHVFTISQLAPWAGLLSSELHYMLSSSMAWLVSR